ncbi:MAG: hypothetical protein FWB80_11440 [Defluviitaleaceae bacterium]|nr:hypothetical protein [Defluviitaleaceae bacterium]
MDKNGSQEKTSYETNPVEGPEDAICAFVEAYDVLQASAPPFAAELKTAMYRPVTPHDYDSPPVSIYEIGVVYVPDGTAGKYGINSPKLKAALRQRKSDVRALFVQEDGILPHLCDVLTEFLEEPYEDEYIHSVTLRFLNECRRLIAMWE